MNLNKRILVVLLIFVGIVAILFLSGYFSISRMSAVHEISGSITEARNGSVVVKGIIWFSDAQGTRSEEKTIEFTVTSKTVLNNLAIRITAEQMRGGKQFSPENKVISGSFSELVPGTNVKILSKDNLFSADEAVASEISYTSYDIEFPEQ